MPTGTSGEKFLLDGGGGNRLIFGRDGTEYRMSAGVTVSGNAGSGAPNGVTMGAALDEALHSACDICELLCYGSAVSTDDTDLIETYLEDKWGQP